MKQSAVRCKVARLLFKKSVVGLRHPMDRSKQASKREKERDAEKMHDQEGTDRGGGGERAVKWSEELYRERHQKDLVYGVNTIAARR